MKEDFFVITLMLMWTMGLILVIVFLTPVFRCSSQLKPKVEDDVTVCVNITDGSIYDQILVEHSYSDKVAAIVLLLLAFFMTIIYVCVNYFKYKSKIYSNNSIQLV